MPKKSPAPNAALIVNAPEPVTVIPPDTTALMRTYEAEIMPLASYTITNNAEYIQGNLDWQKAKQFAATMDALFEQPCKLAYQAHKSLTSLRESLKSPAVQIASHIGNELLRYKAEEDRKRREEEARIAAEEEARREAERKRLQALADLERMKAEEERLALLESTPEWERDDDFEASLPPVPEAVVVELPPAAPVSVPSTVPQVMGGPKVVDKPWECIVDDPVGVLRWIIENPQDRLMYVSLNMTELNKKCRELEDQISTVIPGTRAVRGQILKRS